MKYNVGDWLVVLCLGELIPCEVKRVYTRTIRYRIEYSPGWNRYKETQRIVDENELFLSESDYVDCQINDKKYRISLLQIEISTLQNKKYESNRMSDCHK